MKKEALLQDRGGGHTVPHTVTLLGVVTCPSVELYSVSPPSLFPRSRILEPHFQMETQRSSDSTSSPAPPFTPNLGPRNITKRFKRFPYPHFQFSVTRSSSPEWGVLPATCHRICGHVFSQLLSPPSPLCILPLLLNCKMTSSPSHLPSVPTKDA